MNLLRDNINYAEFLALPEDKAAVRSAGLYAYEVGQAFWGTATTDGCSLPWDEAKAYVNLRRGKVSLWTGVTHHGKSTALSHFIAHSLSRGERVCIWSGEETPDVVLETLVVQATLEEKPSQELIDSYLLDIGERLWFYDQLGVVKADRLLGVMAYACRQLKTTQFIIDSLMKTDVRGDDYDGQKDFVNQLAAFARATGCHVHLVAHMRKGRDEAIGSIMDVKGAGDIIAQVDNIFMVWKNKKKLDEQVKTAPDPKLMDEPDTVVVVDKQRGRKTWTGRFNLSYHPRFMQFTRRHAEPKRHYVAKPKDAPL